MKEETIAANIGRKIIMFVISLTKLGCQHVKCILHPIADLVIAEAQIYLDIHLYQYKNTFYIWRIR